MYRVVVIVISFLACENIYSWNSCPLLWARVLITFNFWTDLPSLAVRPDSI